MRTKARSHLLDQRGDARQGVGGYVALAGEFAVLAELALRRIDGTPTLGHTKEVDILALNRVTGRTFMIEVKTTSKGVRASRKFGASYAWLMHQKHGGVVAPNLLYCFVALSPGDPPKFFLVPSADVALYIRWEFAHAQRHRVRRTGKVSATRMFRIPAGTAHEVSLPPAWRDGRWRRWEADWGIFGRASVGVGRSRRVPGEAGGQKISARITNPALGEP